MALILGVYITFGGGHKMSISPKNIVADSPTVTANLALDASPIYTAIDASVSVAATSYTVDNYDYAVASASHSFTQLQREPLIDATTSYIAYENEEIDGLEAPTYFDGLDDFIFPSSGAGKFAADILSFTDVSTPPFSPPRFYTPDATGSQSYFFNEVVTETNNNPDPPEDNLVDIRATVGTPIFTGTILGGDLKMTITFAGVVFGSGPGAGTVTEDVEVDCSSWTSADFRDIRGTYGKTTTDGNGIAYTWSLTVS